MRMLMDHGNRAELTDLTKEAGQGHGRERGSQAQSDREEEKRNHINLRGAPPS